jgi:hypothetical protein
VARGGLRYGSHPKLRPATAGQLEKGAEPQYASVPLFRRISLRDVFPKLMRLEENASSFMSFEHEAPNDAYGMTNVLEQTMNSTTAPPSSSERRSESSATTSPATACPIRRRGRLIAIKRSQGDWRRTEAPIVAR